MFQYVFNKFSLLFFALLIIIFSVGYTQKVASSIKNQEIEQANELANAYKILNSSDAGENELTYALEKIKNNKNIPIIWTDAQNNIIAYKNFNDSNITSNKNYLKNELQKLEDNRINILIDEHEKHFLYYKDSDLLRTIKNYPYYQLFLVFLFFLVSFIAFSSIRKAEQNQVWVGLAKETAHQLGTPISSLSAWIELLKDKLNEEDDKLIADEMNKDINRLILVANRFSKIGSTPELSKQNLIPILEQNVAYMKMRAAHSIVFQVINNANTELYANINIQLFEWVIENLLKNALDAMNKNGKITIFVAQEKEDILIDVIDTGKGIANKNIKDVFKTGYSTKKRGWGIGLALSKRIIEDYHKGKIFVKESTEGKGTTFRITIKNIMINNSLADCQL
ncbi:MAG: HAMP domain-containing histidine kinase [Sphingobacteriales bacterium]|nr:MAG: HAMP domain-containing histidine kinase [Sphingobacteriales bacterium]